MKELNNTIIKALEIQNKQDANLVATSPVKVAKIIKAWYTSKDYHDNHNSIDAMSKNDDLIGLGMINGTICAIMSHGLYTSNAMAVKEIRGDLHPTYELVLTTIAVRTVSREYLSPDDRGLDNVEAWVKLTGGTVICTREG